MFIYIDNNIYYYKNGEAISEMLLNKKWTILAAALNGTESLSSRFNLLNNANLFHLVNMECNRWLSQQNKRYEFGNGNTFICLF